VVGNIKEPGVYVGYPARPRGEWGRMEVLMGRLPELLKKIRKLEKQIGDFPVKHPPSE
jgi:UDP-3-O-[3-hydroxymyristoyl] glucosamine N-acyltransferase